MTGELFGRSNKPEKSIEDSPVSAEQLGGLLALIADNTISGKIAKDVFAEMFDDRQKRRARSSKKKA